MMKKFLTLVLAISMLCSLFAIPTFASSEVNSTNLPTVQQAEKMVEVLRFVEEQKNAFGLGYVNFDDLEVGEKIHVYEYIDNSFSEKEGMYPLFAEGALVALAWESGNGLFQIETGLVPEISASNALKIALIYDRNGCYAFDGENFQRIAISSLEVPYRSDIADDLGIIGVSTLVLSDLSISTSLNFSNVQTRAQSYFSCGVKYVPQAIPGEDHSNICWAATIACIVNYINNRSLTAIEVAKAANGNIFWNQGKTLLDSCAFMNEAYGTVYTGKSSVPSDDAILRNIQSGKPIFGGFRWLPDSVSEDKGRHFGTIFGINILSGPAYISVMDPECGAKTAYWKDGTYQFRNWANNGDLILDQAACAQW